MTSTVPELRVNPLAPTVGAEIIGLDVRNLNPEEFLLLRAAFREHRLLAIRSQHLEPADLVAFAERWGTPLVHPLTPHLDGHPPVQAIENFGKTRTLNEHWHTDMSFEPVPPKVTMLHALHVPALGGDTAFADQHLAYESLSPAMQDMLEGRRALHRSDALARIMGADPAAAPSGIHPVVRTHPDTGRRALYVCRAFTQRLEGMTREESAGLLGFLFERSTRPDFTYRHKWQDGDLVMWDNRCLLHYAIHDHGDDVRLLHRVTVEGEIPV